MPSLDRIYCILCSMYFLCSNVYSYFALYFFLYFILIHFLNFPLIFHFSILWNVKKLFFFSILQLERREQLAKAVNAVFSWEDCDLWTHPQRTRKSGVTSTSLAKNSINGLRYRHNTQGCLCLAEVMCRLRKKGWVGLANPLTGRLANHVGGAN